MRDATVLHDDDAVRVTQVAEVVRHEDSRLQEANANGCMIVFGPLLPIRTGVLKR